MELKIEWQRVASEFDQDGGRPNLVIRKPTIVDWQAVLDVIRQRYQPLTFTVDNEPAEPPIRVEQILALAVHASPRLRFTVGCIPFTCHFYADEIEFDFAVEDVDGPERLRDILGFLSQLAETTHKPAVMTPDGMTERDVFTFDPHSGQFTYAPIKPTCGLTSA